MKAPLPTNRILLFFGLLLIALLPATQEAPAQPGAKKDPLLEDLVSFKVRVEPEDPFDPANAQTHSGGWKVRRGQIVRVAVDGTLTKGWHTYPITQRTSQQDAN